MSLLLIAIQSTRPSLSIEEIKRYDIIKTEMNGDFSRKQNKERPRIGFK